MDIVWCFIVFFCVFPASNASLKAFGEISSVTLTSVMFFVFFHLCLQVLILSCKVMAPFTPFFTEVLYQNMQKVSNESEESIHYCSFPLAEGKVLLVVPCFSLENVSFLISLKPL